MLFLKSLNRYMERNHAASRALLVQLNKKSIADLDELSEGLWLSIKSSSNESWALEVIDDGVMPLEFIVRLFVKIGFSCEDSIRLMMQLHKRGAVLLAKADEDILLALQDYINAQAETHDTLILTNILKI